jgi:hypothetical protein
MKYFQTLKRREGNIMTIVGRDALIVGSERATITLPMGTHITMENALLYPDSTRTLLGFRDVHKNGFHVERHMDNKEKFLLLTKLTRYGKQICEKISSPQTILYFTYIKSIKHVAYNIIFQDVNTFQNWHDRLRHPGIGMMKKSIGNSIGHDMENTKFPQNKDFLLHCLCN